MDLGLPAASPPRLLFHGTGRQSLSSILRDGLQRGRRHHVHLSPNVETALRVGRRHGPPVVLDVAAAEMAAAGHVFHVTANDVWLVEAVPPEFLSPRRE